MGKDLRGGKWGLAFDEPWYTHRGLQKLEIGGGEGNMARKGEMQGKQTVKFGLERSGKKTGDYDVVLLGTWLKKRGLSGMQVHGEREKTKIKKNCCYGARRGLKVVSKRVKGKLARGTVRNHQPYWKGWGNPRAVTKCKGEKRKKSQSAMK